MQHKMPRARALQAVPGPQAPTGHGGALRGQAGRLACACLQLADHGLQAAPADFLGIGMPEPEDEGLVFPARVIDAPPVAVTPKFQHHGHPGRPARIDAQLNPGRSGVLPAGALNDHHIARRQQEQSRGMAIHQRTVKRLGEASPLLGGGLGPVAPQDQLACIQDVDVRPQLLVDDAAQGRGVGRKREAAGRDQAGEPLEALCYMRLGVGSGFGARYSRAGKKSNTQ